MRRSVTGCFVDRGIIQVIDDATGKIERYAIRGCSKLSNMERLACSMCGYIDDHAYAYRDLPESVSVHWEVPMARGRISVDPKAVNECVSRYRTGSVRPL